MEKWNLLGIIVNRLKSGSYRVKSGRHGISTGFEEVNTGGLGVSTGSRPVSYARGQRERKAPMIVEETQAPKRTKEQIQQEEASLTEALRLQTLKEEETAKQVHLDALLAKRLAEEEELTKQQKKRKAQVQFEAQFFTKEIWDAIRAKLEANAELKKDVLGKDLSEQDFAKRMVDLVNQRKKHFAEKRAKAKRNKPMTQSQLRSYMSNYLKNQGTWKLSQLKKLKFEGIKEEFENPQGDLETDKEESVEAMNPTPLDTEYNIMANWKIFQQEICGVTYRLKCFMSEYYGVISGICLITHLNEDVIWGINTPAKDDLLSYYDKVLTVHCLTLEACNIYMVADRKFLCKRCLPSDDENEGLLMEKWN
ncbi:hypothetical protein Tco_1280834 [Tanacetum coccineum]